MMTRTMTLPIVMTAVLMISNSDKCWSQKGLPSLVPTSTLVHTNFPEHLDFKDSLVNALVVPDGFEVIVAARGLGKPRMMAFSSDGSLYVTRRDQGDVLLLRDTDRDGKFDDMDVVVTMFKGVHGIVLKDGSIFLCSNKVLKRGTVLPDGTIGDLKILIKDLPEGGQHGNRTLGFDPEGMLYISVGSDCNDCNETNPENATLLQLNADGTHRRIFARGLRNTIGFDWHPVTKEIWGADNGGDGKGDDFPPEELNNIVDGGIYGWPWVYGKQLVDESREEPIESSKEEFAKTTQPSQMDFPAHAAPINLKFLSGARNFPADYRDDALVSFHGSWNRSKPTGYKVVRVVFENGKPVRHVDFLSGFLSADGKTRFGRPAGLAISPDGNVFITDDENGVIYSVRPKRK